MCLNKENVVASREVDRCCESSDSALTCAEGAEEGCVVVWQYLIVVVVGQQVEEMVGPICREDDVVKKGEWAK